MRGTRQNRSHPELIIDIVQDQTSGQVMPVTTIQCVQSKIGKMKIIFTFYGGQLKCCHKNDCNLHPICGMLDKLF